MIESQLIRILILLAVFASVFIFAQVILSITTQGRAHSSAINKRLKLIAKGIGREDVLTQLLKNDPLAYGEHHGLIGRWILGLRRNLQMAAIAFGPGEVLLGMVILFLVIGLALGLAAWIGGFPLTLGVVQLIVALSVSVAVAIPLLVISFLAQRRRKRMQEQFPVALDIFVRALRAGHPIASAIDLLTKEMEDPIGSEFGLVGDEVSYGAELTEALTAMAERWDLDDMRMFVVSLAVQNETGGNLAEILENLSEVIRERMSLFLKVRALSSEGRMTGWVLTAAPIVTFLMVFMVNPGFYLEVATDPIFYIGFPIIICVFLLGVFWIRKMVDLKV